MKALRRMYKAAFAHHINSLKIYYHTYAYRNVKAVFAAFNFIADALPFPFIPVGNVRKLRFAVRGGKASKGRKLIAFSAGVAYKACASPLHLSFGAAVGAFV